MRAGRLSVRGTRGVTGGPLPLPAADGGGREQHHESGRAGHGCVDPPPAGPLVQAQRRLGPHGGQQPATAVRDRSRHRVQQRRAEPRTVRLRRHRQLVHLQRTAEPRPCPPGPERLGDLPVTAVGRKDLRGDPGRGETGYRPPGRRHRRREPGPERVPREPLRIAVGPGRILVPGRGRERPRVHVADPVGVPVQLPGRHRSYLDRHRTVPRISPVIHRRITGAPPAQRGNLRGELPYRAQPFARQARLKGCEWPLDPTHFRLSRARHGDTGTALSGRPAAPSPSRRSSQQKESP